MVEGAEKEGILKPGSALIESSSGNLGLALSMISANKGYDFVCVTDSRCNRAIMRDMQALVHASMSSRMLRRIAMVASSVAD